MSEELSFNLMGWWNEQSFPNKQLYRLEETGDLVLCANNNIKERIIAKIAPENASTIISTLQEKFGAVESKVREMEIEWIATEDKQKMADKVAQLKDYLQHVSAIGDFEKPALLVHSWEHALYLIAEENYAVKLKLVEMAESLAENEQFKETTQALKDIADKWKQAGYVDKGRNDKLWNRLEAARKTFHDRKRVHHDEEEKDLLHRLDLKIDLVEQAEAIAKSEDWKATTDTFHRLTEEWKTIGHTINKKNEELWQRFLAAKSAFFEKKREHANKISQEHEKNYAAKLSLVEKAEILKDSTEWNVTTQAFAGLMDEWKKTGRIPQEKGEELWKRFNGAQEQFFTAKKQHFEQIKNVYEQNYTQKKAILDRAEQIKNSNRWGETTTEMLQLLDEWKKIGPVARKYGDKMWEEFNAARKHFFARKDANRDQRKQYAVEQKEVRAEQAKEAVIKLGDDLKEEQNKLADFKTAIENITPGKKAAELRSHLEKLIEDTEAKIKRMQEKFSTAQKESDNRGGVAVGEGHTGSAQAQG